ncbi:U4/U6.U5 small nuclear ribonucleoprotein 27 kDa protein, partial [Cyphomyrmex costatus]
VAIVHSVTNNCKYGEIGQRPHPAGFSKLGFIKFNKYVNTTQWDEVVLHHQEDGGIDLENEIVTEIGGEDGHEKEDEERDRVKSRDRDRDRERERDRHRRSYSRSRSRERERSRDRSRHRVKPKPSTNERPIITEIDYVCFCITEADLQGKTPEEQEMMRIMGFCDFDTTKGKKVDGNDVGAVHVILKRKYRQYMNRKGGFNRPLDFVA